MRSPSSSRALFLPFLALVVLLAASLACGSGNTTTPAPAAKTAAPEQAAGDTSAPKSTDSPQVEPTKAPTAAPKPAEPGTSRSNPLALGSEFKGDTWSIVISDVIRGQDAAKAVAAANTFNEPPRKGYEYLIANVKVKNISTKQEAQSADFAVDVRVTGDKNIAYSRASVVPEKSLEGSLFPDGAAEGQIVFEVPSDEKNLMFIVGEMMSLDTDAMRFVAIDPDAKVTPDPALAEIKPADLGKQRDNPAKIGETLVAGPWQFEIVEAIRGDKAAGLVKEANSFNEPAPDGQEYVLVKLKARYLGTDEPDRRQMIDGSFLGITGEKNVVYERPSVVAPAPILDAVLFAGGETEGWEVLSVSKDEKGLMAVFEPSFSFSRDDTRYIALE